MQRSEKSEKKCRVLSESVGIISRNAGRWMLEPNG
jgi:hypothetical protein